MKYAFFLLALIAVGSATADIMNEFEEETLIEGREGPQEPQEENKMTATEGVEEVTKAKQTPEEPQAVDTVIKAAEATYLNITALNAQISKVIDLKFRKEPGRIYTCTCSYYYSIDYPSLVIQYNSNYNSMLGYDHVVSCIDQPLG